MQTLFRSNQLPGIEGMPVGKRLSRSFLLPELPQIQTLTLTDASAAASEAWVMTVVDDQTSQSYTVNITSGATLALTLDAIVAAILAHSKVNDLLSAAEDGATILTLTAKHKRKSYTVTMTTGGGSATVAYAETQAAGSGAVIPFGRAVVRGTVAGEFAALGATSAASDVVGLLFRTDGNHMQSVADSEDSDAVDGAHRGWTYSIMEQGRALVLPEETVAPGDPVFVRRALTSSAGSIGAFRRSAAGSTQVATITAIADHQVYAIEYGYLGEQYTFMYGPTDGTTATDDAIDGLEDSAAENAPTGVTVSAASAAATMTLTAAAGTVFDYVRNIAWGEDTEAAACTVSVAAGDADCIDCSALFEWETAGSTTQLARLKVKMA